VGLDGQQRILVVVSLEIADGEIQSIRSIVNPDKLRHLGPVSDLPTTPLTPRSATE
jgi:RNA polymerase sigma-70 factor (ECF subfamily)